MSVDAKTRRINASVVAELKLTIPQKFEMHLEDKENPHGVTAEQVGAYTQEMIDLKLEEYVKIVDLKKVYKHTILLAIEPYNDGSYSSDYEGTAIFEVVNDSSDRITTRDKLLSENYHFIRGEFTKYNGITLGIDSICKITGLTWLSNWIAVEIYSNDNAIIGFNNCAFAGTYTLTDTVKQLL